LGLLIIQNTAPSTDAALAKWSRSARARVLEFFDVELRTDPPCIEVVAHEQHTELVTAMDDLVLHDAQTRLQFEAAHAQLVQRIHRRVGGQIRVVDRRSIDRSLAVGHGEVLGYRQSLAVADHHADDLTASGTHE
jgi:NAD-dependent oxidoreductase involved in siderophore biosynthesis